MRRSRESRALAHDFVREAVLRRAPRESNLPSMRRFAWAVLAMSACAAGGSGTPPPSTGGAPPPKPPPPAIHEGALVTFRATQEIGRDTYHDDGDVLTSQLELGGKKSTVSISRRNNTVSCGDGAPVVLDEETVPLENGHWAAYAFLAERFHEDRDVKVLLPCSGVRLDAHLGVTREGEETKLVLSIGKLAVHVRVDPRGAVLGAEVPAQGLVVRRADDGPPPAPPARALPPGVTEEHVHVERGGVVLQGSLWLPAASTGKLPVALIVAGSGPTDRDGNNAAGLATDAYRLIAAALAAHGVASLRFDKRGIGESGANFAMEKIVFQDFVDDAAAWVRWLRASPRFGPVSLIGHSEGATLVTMVAQHEHVDALVLVAGTGRHLDVLMREQLARGGLDDKALGEYDRIIAALRKGAAVERVPPELAPLFSPAVQPFLRSAMLIDPVAELKKVPRGRVTILQGETDVQVSVDDAKRLAKARPDAKLVLLPRTNHVLKEEAQATRAQGSYADATRPLAPGVVDALVGALAK